MSHPVDPVRGRAIASKKTNKEEFVQIHVAAVGLVVALVSQVSNAEDNAKVAKAIAERYVATLGCDTNKVEPRNIALVTDPKANPEDNLSSYYVTTVVSDLQCAGGSGTAADHIVVVGNAALKATLDGSLQAADLRVRPELSEPGAVTMGRQETSRVCIAKMDNCRPLGWNMVSMTLTAVLP
ncbi:hypothetical protein [Caballeronia grimmiae]|uniref:hypothetical protein n=1 Tax=Caballeronia grimmiae TaxID=1071679 RepID=UPI001FD334B8|nr:hypothetical protein [Caballeronia grimmiae]